MAGIADNLNRVREEMAEACRGAGRRPEEVALMAVSKVHPVECMVEAYEAGQRLFGENRVQEYEAKAGRMLGLAGLEVHLIGPLQNNKTTKAAEFFRCGGHDRFRKDGAEAGYGGGSGGARHANSGRGEALA